MSPPSDDEWVLLRRFDRAFDAEVARSFLQEHDVEARLQGAASSVAALDHMMRATGVRLVVRRHALGAAREALDALDAGESAAPYEGDEPPAGPAYRGATPRADEGPRRRYRGGAVVLALALPVGGGHFYAQHHAAGAVYAAGIVGCAALAVALERPWLAAASVLLVLADAVFGSIAVERHNEGRVPSPARQGASAALAVALSVLSAYIAVGVGQRPGAPALGHRGPSAAR